MNSTNQHLPPNWRLVEVKEVARVNELSVGKDYPHEGIEYIDIASVEKGEIKSKQNLELKHAPSRARRIVRNNDIVISTVRPNLEHYVFIKQAKDNTIASTGFAVISAKTINPRFLYYCLTTKALTAYLSQIADTHTSAYPACNPDVIENASIPQPPAMEQDRIADILGSLEDKIELNQRMNRTLEAIAQAIFKSWFVDFDPVRTKAEGRDTGLPKDIDKLLPDSFEDSELGSIPIGWKVKPLPEVIEVNPRRGLQKGDVAPYVEMGNMPTSSARPVGWIDRPFTSGMKFVNGDVLVARITPCLENGKTAFVDFLGEDQVGWGSTEYIVLHAKAPLPVEYAYFLARTEDFRSYAIKNMTGTSGRQRVPAACFDLYMLAVPPEKVVRYFGNISKLVMAGIKANDEESRLLCKIRDSLLPKLLSGQIRVKVKNK